MPVRWKTGAWVKGDFKPYIYICDIYILYIYIYVFMVRLGRGRLFLGAVPGPSL